MKRLAAILAFLFITVFAHAASIALIFTDPNCPHQFAVLNGAKDALRDLSIRFKTEFTIENRTPEKEKITPRDQAEALYRAKNDGIKGVILFPARGEDDYKLGIIISKLAQENYPISIIGRDLNAPGRLCAVVNDDAKFEEIFKNAMPPISEKENFKLLYIVKGDESKKISHEEAEKLLPPSISMEMLKNIAGTKEIAFYESEYFSNLQERYKSEWTALDNYGIIITDERILADMSEIQKDKDRAFIFSMGANPILANYLRDSRITLSADGDYYGYGYISAIKLVEKIMENKNPRKPFESLPPLHYTPADLEKFNNEWIKNFK